MITPYWLVVICALCLLRMQYSIAGLYEICVGLAMGCRTLIEVDYVMCRGEQAQGDASSWRQKYESAAAAAESEEADEMSSKRKKQMMTARMTEYETQLASAVAKTSALEKIKNQLQFEADSLATQLDKVDNHCDIHV